MNKQSKKKSESESSKAKHSFNLFIAALKKQSTTVEQMYASLLILIYLIDLSTKR